MAIRKIPFVFIFNLRKSFSAAILYFIAIVSTGSDCTTSFFLAHFRPVKGTKKPPENTSLWRPGGHETVKCLSAPLLCVPGFPLVCSESENELPEIATIYVLL